MRPHVRTHAIDRCTAPHAHPPRRIAAALLLAALAGLALAAPAQAAPKRVVALEWDALENVVALGVKPVGAADLRGFRQYVSVGLPGGITDIGTRGEPNLERIAKLRPDLIVVPDFRAGRNLKTLRKIARVLVTHPYPGNTGDGAQFDAMVKDFRALGSALDRRGRAESVLRGMSSTLASLRTRLHRAGRGGARVTIATPGGTSSSPAARLFTDNSAAAEALRRLGLRNAWTAGGVRYGFSTVGVEALRKVQSGWLAFIYPSAFAAQIKRFTGQASYARLDMVKRKRVRKLAGDTWLFGGPVSTRIFAERLTAALT
jgi:ABC-type Fe3+-hydroxamate transport system substrate-binding protein